MSFIQADLDAIEMAIATGLLEVRYDDKTVKYQSTEALLKARDTIRDALGISASTPRSSLSTFSKG